MSTEDRKTLTVFTLMDEHVEVHGFLYSVRINGEVVDVKKKTSVLSRGPLKPKPYSGGPLSPLLQHRMSHIELGFTFLLLLRSLGSHSCSSSSSSWSSSMASIWFLEHTSLMGAEFSPSTTSSLDISFFCGQSRRGKWKQNHCCAESNE